MVRISDILKGKGSTPEPEPRRPKDAEVPQTKDAGMEGVQISRVISGAKSEAEKDMHVAKTMHELRLDPEESRRIYDQALDCVRNIYNQAQDKEAAADLREAYDVVQLLVDRLVLGDKELLALIDTSSEDNYLYCHTLNVCLLSLDVGLGLGYNKSKLNELGLGALLHDIGMLNVMELSQQPRNLSEQEFAEIKKHPLYGSGILSKIKDMQEGILLINDQVHERLNGGGYPKGLKENQIHEYAKVVAIVDVYEALIHPRPHRPAMNPHEAIKELLNINSSGIFETSILKILINKIGLYPIGSWIELNTGEFGKVISSSQESPLRPKVNIVFGQDKERLPQIKALDLLQHPNVFIKRAINPKEANLTL